MPYKDSFANVGCNQMFMFDICLSFEIAEIET